MARPRILLAEPEDFSPRALAKLQAWADVDVRQTARDELPAALRDYDAVWFRLAHRVDAKLVSNAERCRVLATPVTGIDHIDLDAPESLPVAARVALGILVRALPDS